MKWVDRSNDITKEIYNFKVVHGNALVHYLKQQNFVPSVRVSDDIHVVTATNHLPDQCFFDYTIYKNLITNYTNTFIPNYQCFRDKFQSILDVCNNTDTPYILYFDCRDAVLVSDIMNPREILDSYKCKLLFEANDGFHETDHPGVNKSYLTRYAHINNASENDYYENSKIYLESRNKMENYFRRTYPMFSPYIKTIGTGVFLGERMFLIDTLNTILSYVDGDSKLGYPFGELDDTRVWKYVYSTNMNDMQFDFNNLFFLWGYQKKLEISADHWEHFNFFNNLYKNVKI